MGMSKAAVFIKLENPNDYKLEKIAENFFNSIVSIKDEWQSGFDFRHSNKIIIEFYKNGISIVNSDFVNQILINRDKHLIAKLYKYFNFPETILVYMHYDSGDTFGFCYIKCGEINRFRYSLSTDYVTCDFGNPLDEELKVLNSQIHYQEDENGEEDDFGDIIKYYMYKIEGEAKSRSYHFINSHLTSVVMTAKLGFGLYDEDTQRAAKFITLQK